MFAEHGVMNSILSNLWEGNYFKGLEHILCLFNHCGSVKLRVANCSIDSPSVSRICSKGKGLAVWNLVTSAAVNIAAGCSGK